MTEGEAESEGQASWGLVARGLLNLYWVLSWVCVLLMVETVSGARGPSAGTRISSQFPASGVNQSPVVDVSVQVGNWHQVGVYSANQVCIEHLLCSSRCELNLGICQGMYTVDKNPCPHGASSLLGGWIKK